MTISNQVFLSIENSSDLYSISLSNNNKIFYNEIFGKKITSKYILKNINYMLIKNKIYFNNIDTLLFSSGPGNSTGTKIISAVIKGLSLGWKLPVIKLSSLTIVAFEAYLIYKKKKYFCWNKYTFRLYLL